MNRSAIALAIVLQLTTASHAQGPAYVPQLSGNSGASVPQADSSSGAFVQQLSPNARPRQVQPVASPSVPVELEYVERQYIAVPIEEQGEQKELVTYQDEGVLPFKNSRPTLPALTSGVAVSLTTDDDVLPSVGAGAVVL